MDLSEDLFVCRPHPASEWAEKGLTALEIEEGSSVLLWPATSNPIPGTEADDLRCAMEALKRQSAICSSRKELRFLSVDLAATPRTGLVCRASPCLKEEEPHPNLNFISTSPNLTKEIPHVLLFCSSKCKTGYHASCWARTARQQRKEMNSRGGSKQTKQTCPTPDCHGVVTRVEDH